MLDNSTYQWQIRFKSVRVGQTFVIDDRRYIKLGLMPTDRYNARLITGVREFSHFAPDDLVYINNKPQG